MSTHQQSWTRWLLVLCVAGWLSGCAMTPPRVLLTEAEVVLHHGKPTRIWDNPDGTRTFEYATQPFGTQCWMFTVDRDGKVREQYDALSRSHLARVRPGLTQDEVRRLLGAERSVQRFSNSGEEVWDWNIERTMQGVSATRFNVHFVEGKVLRTSENHEYPAGDWRFGLGYGSGGGAYWGLGWGWPRYPYHGPGPYPFWW